MIKQLKKQQLISILFFLQVLFSILLFIYSAIDTSSSPEILFYSKEKFIILFIHLLVVIFPVILFIIYKNKKTILEKIFNLVNSLNFQTYISLIIFSLISSYLWSQSFQKFITYWGVLEQLIPLILTSILLLISFLLIAILLKAENAQRKYSFSKNKLLRVIIVSFLSFLLFRFLSNSSNDFLPNLTQLLLLIILLFYSSFVARYFEKKNPTHTSKKSLIAFIFILITSVFLARPQESFINWNNYVSYLQLKPIFYFIFNFFIGVFAINLVFLLKKPKNISKKIYQKLAALKGFVLPFIILSIIFIILIRHFGFIRIPDQYNWRGLANPIFIFQILIAISIVGGYVATQTLFINHKKTKKIITFLIPLILIIIAIVSWQWQFQTEMRHYFIIQPAMPNYQYYPGSDAQRMDIPAQLIRYGIPITGNKPFANYLIFLYHAVMGQDYTKIYYAQYIFLLLLPLGIYAIGKQLKAPQAGFLAAIFAIFQERNSIILAKDISNITPQLLMSEIPTLIFIIWSTYFLIRFLKEREFQTLILSGLLSVFATFSRPNALFVFLIQLVILFLFQFNFFSSNKNSKKSSLLLFFSSFIIPFAIWTSSDYLIHGRSVLLDKIKSVITRTIGINQTTLHINALQVSPQKQLLSSIFDQLQVIINHFLNNIWGVFAFLPTKINIQFPLSIKSISFVFWDTQSPWNGTLTLIQWVFLIINLLLIIIGFYKLWQKNKFIAFIPLMIQISYIASLAFARTSGGRYLEPISWITLIYYSTGIWSVLVFAIKHLTKIPVHKLEIHQAPFLSSSTSSKANTFLILFLVLLFASMIFIPFLMPKVEARQSDESIQKLEDIYQLSNNDPQTIQNWINNNQNLEIFETVAFYPVIDNNILTAKIITNDFYSRIYFPIQKDQTVTLPHDTKMLIAGYSELNQYPIFVVFAYAYQDQQGNWLLFEADQNNLVDLNHQVDWTLY